MIGLTYIMQLDGITGKELAEKIGVTPSTISQWEKQVRPIAKNRLPQLSEIFPAYDPAYFQKELNEVDKLTLENVEKEKQIRSLNEDDTLNSIQERRRLQNEIYKNETLIDQQKLIEDMAVLFSYTYSVNVNSFSDVSVQRIIVNHFSDLMKIEGKILFEYFENENNAEAFKEASKEILISIKKFSEGVADSLNFFQRLIEYTNRNE